MSGFGFAPEAEAKLDALLTLLKGSAFAPTSEAALEASRDTHLADSLSGLSTPELKGATSIVDIGSGAGFPGLPLAIALHAATVHLLEATGRKCEFMRELVAGAGIPNANVVNARAEEWTPDPADGVDVATARAVGSLPELAELASPLLREDGALVAWKGDRVPAEEDALTRAAPRLAMELDRVEAVVPFEGSRERHLYVVRKVGPTPNDLPRRPGMARKRPFGGEQKR